MMKAIISIVILLFSITAFSQEQRVEYEKISNNLVKATYYFVDNSDIIQREGFFNSHNQLQDMWVSYDINGNKKIIAYYDKNKKVGVWTYFSKDKINFVTYKENKLIGVEEKLLVVN
ncbi:toxin-antitoxin system YwqK family antitoxin [Lutibacter sp.]